MAAESTPWAPYAETSVNRATAGIPRVGGNVCS